MNTRGVSRATLRCSLKHFDCGGREDHRERDQSAYDYLATAKEEFGDMYQLVTALGLCYGRALPCGVVGLHSFRDLCLN